MRMSFAHTLMVGLGAVALTLTAAGCAADAQPEEQRDAGTLKVEACFVNQLPDANVALTSIKDGSGVQWEGVVKPGASVCTRSKDIGRLFGQMRPANDTQAYTYRFVNANLGYPNGAVIVGTVDDGSYGPGMCKGFSAMEVGVLDSGSTRFSVQRLTDSDVKRFTVTISPSQSQQIPTKDCYYEYG